MCHEAIKWQVQNKQEITSSQAVARLSNAILGHSMLWDPEVLTASDVGCEGSWMKNVSRVNRYKDTCCGSRCQSHTNPWKLGMKSCRMSV